MYHIGENFGPNVIFGEIFEAFVRTNIRSYRILGHVELFAFLILCYAHCVHQVDIAGTPESLTAAYFMDFTRLYLYAFLFAVAVPITFWLKDNTALTYPSLYVFSLTAGPMLVIGWILFIRFLRQYPHKARTAC